MKINKILTIVMLFVEHLLTGNRFLYELGNFWYSLWLRTPIDMNSSYCVFFKKESFKR